MQKWEYKVVQFVLPYLHERELNELGEQGWELVAIDETDYYIFKRRKS